MDFRFSIFDFRLSCRDGRRARGSSFIPLGLSSGRRLHPSSFRSAFSFAEILFAIIILGIGFIMVAAIFPVAIQQAKTTSDEVAGSTIARQATNAISNLAAGSDEPVTQTPAITDTSPLFPGTDLYNAPPATTAAKAAAIAVSPAPTPAAGQSITSRGKVLSFYDPTRLDNLGTIKYPTNQWNAISGNLISANNPANAWIGLYKRDVIYTNNGAAVATNASTLQLFIIPVQASAAPVFTTADTTLLPTAAPIQATLLPKPVRVAVIAGDQTLTGVSLLAFDLNDPNGNTQINVLGAAENAYVIISDDHIQTPAGPSPTSDDRGYMNGRIFKLGARRTDLETSSTGVASLDAAVSSRVVYELQAGNDFTTDSGPDGIPKNADDVNTIGFNGISPSTVTVSGTADAFLIGKGYTPGTTTFEGQAMPTGAFISFIAVN